MDPLEALGSELASGPVIVRIKPGKRETAIRSSEPFVIDVAAKPVEGAANDELLAYLKRTIGPCRITSGSSSRTKRIELRRPHQ